MRQDCALHGFKFRTRLHAELAVQRLASGVVDGQGVGLAAGSIQRPHQLRLEGLAQWSVCHEAAQLGDLGEVTARGKLGVDPPLNDDAPKLIEPDTLRAHGVLTGNVRKCGPPPQSKRGREPARGGLRIARLRGSCRLGGELLERRDVDCRRSRAGAGSRGAGSRSGPAPRALRRPATWTRRAWRTLIGGSAPHTSSTSRSLLTVRPSSRTSIARIARWRALADLDRPARTDDLERAQDPELHDGHRRTACTDLRRLAVALTGPL